MNIIRAEKKYIGQMAEIEKECFTDPWSEAIALEVRESNAHAIAIYEKNGFESVGIRKNFYSDPKENGIVMIRRIERDQDEC